jgi:hypothetical protein
MRRRGSCHRHWPDCRPWSHGEIVRSSTFGAGLSPILMTDVVTGGVYVHAALHLS